MARHAPMNHGGAYVVLAYHQVVEHWDGLQLAVEAPVFREQLQFLRNDGEIVSVAELVARWRRGVRPAGRVYALTFDDGYASLAAVAHPILKAFGCPATVFLATGFMDQPSVFPWWDQLRHFVSTTREKIEWLGDTFPLRSASEKFRFFKHASRLIVHDARRLPKLLELVSKSLEIVAQPRNEFLDWDTVRALTAHGIFDFAPHTVTHPVLSACSNAADEIAQSKQRLLDETGIDSRIFAYPYGRPEHYSAKVIDMLTALGYEAAFTTVFGHVHANSRALALPRINIGRKDSLRKFVARLRYPSLFDIGSRWRDFRYRALR